MCKYFFFVVPKVLDWKCPLIKATLCIFMAQKDETVTKYLLSDGPQGCHVLSLKTHDQPLGKKCYKGWNHTGPLPKPNLVARIREGRAHSQSWWKKEGLGRFSVFIQATKDQHLKMTLATSQLFSLPSHSPWPWAYTYIYKVKSRARSSYWVWVFSFEKQGVFQQKEKKTLQMKTKLSALFNRHNELGKVRSKYCLIPKDFGGIEYRLGNKL